ncbi:hypothetical protein PJM41_0008 [Salmonella phage vB_SenS_UTK0009]|uniref:Uncharacterized protein n=2 Tax=Epseptimavirus TaxID=2732017 RepID=A0AAE9ZK29_9CAUD|nr:hypothetical protein [Salmonella phage GSW6]WDR22093.1 hypothetical protein PJM41_0008 [Salmonella phage vB_SenS_UTK0009]
MTKRIFKTPEIITVEQAEAVINFCANHDSEVAYYHKDGVINCEMVTNLNIKDGESKL